MPDLEFRRMRIEDGNCLQRGAGVTFEKEVSSSKIQDIRNKTKKDERELKRHDSPEAGGDQQASKIMGSRWTAMC